MSNLDRTPALSTCGGMADVAAEPVRDLIPGRVVMLGESTKVRRLLPTLGRRMVGAWCFIDHYGPDDIAREDGMRVPPHPHTGLQTVSWLHAGEVLHRDSLGSLQMLRPGQLGIMTSGRAIAHSEESPREHSATLHGAQLWVALPDSHRTPRPRSNTTPNCPRSPAAGCAPPSSSARSPARHPRAPPSRPWPAPTSPSHRAAMPACPSNPTSSTPC